MKARAAAEGYRLGAFGLISPGIADAMAASEDEVADIILAHEVERRKAESIARAANGGGA